MCTAQLHRQRSTETLLGYLQGITCDDHLSDLEIANLQHWLETYYALRDHWPFDEITARAGWRHDLLRTLERLEVASELCSIDRGYAFRTIRDSPEGVCEE